MIDMKRVNRYLLTVLLLMVALIVLAATVWHSVYVSGLVDVYQSGRANTKPDLPRNETPHE